jgi:uncharacterized phage protein gp47/JayE
MTLEKGFIAKSFTQIKSEIEDSLIDGLGEVNLVAPSVFANIVSVFAEREANLWELLEAVYSAGVPNTAEGYSLDAVCALNGVKRLEATYSIATAQITATNYTKIPKSTKVAVKTSGKILAFDSDLLVTNEKCYEVKCELTTNIANIYSITINGVVVSYTKLEGQTKEDIVLAIVTEVNINIDTKDIVSAIADGVNIIIITGDIKQEFSCFVSNEIKILYVVNNITVTAEEKGAIPIPANSLTQIITPVSGFNSSSNISSGITGTETETDIALRTRRNNSLKLSGSGTLEAIKAGVANITGVSSVFISENNTGTIDSKGLDPHSFKILVTGGENQAIADTIWQKKPAGIKSFGNITVVVKDSNNKEHNISFARAVPRYIFAKVTITKNPEFVITSTEVIKSSLVTQINKLGAGNNVILNSLFASIFIENGINAATIEIGGTLDEQNLPAFSASDVTVADEEVAITDTAKIEIILQ